MEGRSCGNGMVCCGYFLYFWDKAVVFGNMPKHGKKYWKQGSNECGEHIQLHNNIHLMFANVSKYQPT